MVSEDGKCTSNQGVGASVPVPTSISKEQCRPYEMCAEVGVQWGDELHPQNRHAVILRLIPILSLWKRENKEKGKAIQRQTGLYWEGSRHGEKMSR